jgi:uncharacterized membrane-anchored protein
MRPPSEVVQLVDHLVAKLDRETLGNDYRPGATSSYSVIVAAWERFKALVDRLDHAVANPVDEGAASVLRTADALVGLDVDRVAFWLVPRGRGLRRPRF